MRYKHAGDIDCLWSAARMPSPDQGQALRPRDDPAQGARPRKTPGRRGPARRSTPLATRGIGLRCNHPARSHLQNPHEWVLVVRRHGGLYATPTNRSAAWCGVWNPRRTPMRRIPRGHSELTLRSASPLRHTKIPEGVSPMMLANRNGRPFSGVKNPIWPPVFLFVPI